MNPNIWHWPTGLSVDFHGLPDPAMSVFSIRHAQILRMERVFQSMGQGRKAGKELVRMAMQDNMGQGIMHGFLRDDNLHITHEQATEMYLILTFAAVDTTSALVNNVLTNLAKHPNIQDQVRAEMVNELGGKDYDPDHVRLEYLNQILKETQRLTPALNFTNVKVNIPRDLVVNGFEVPKGTNVIFSNMGIANEERLAGPDPDQFNPDRFSPENMAKRKGTPAAFLDHPIACQPFGFGARMCVGSRIAKLEYTALLCRLIQSFEFCIDEEKSAPQEERIRVSKATTIEYPCPTFVVKRL